MVGEGPERNELQEEGRKDYIQCANREREISAEEGLFDLATWESRGSNLDKGGLGCDSSGRVLDLGTS